jgi:hypothetical protein
VYSIDTSAMMTWWLRRYPPDVFPAMVGKMAMLTASGRLVASEYVIQELGAKPDPIFTWAASQPGLSQATDLAVQQRAVQLIANYPILVNPNSTRAIQADPFVIALAMERGLTVVTSETYAKTKTAGKRRQRTYIPDVCAAKGMLCLDPLEVAPQSWRTFGAALQAVSRLPLWPATQREPCQRARGTVWSDRTPVMPRTVGGLLPDVGARGKWPTQSVC